MSPSGPRCYGSGETRPRPRPAPGDPVPTPAPEDPVPIPGILPHAAPRDPFLIPIPSPLPCSCCPSKLLFPSCPHGAPSSRSVPVPSPLCGGSRCQALLSPAPCAGMGPGPALALPGGPEGVQCPQGCAEGTGHYPGKAEPCSAVPGDAAELMGSVYPALSPPALGPAGLAAQDGSPKPGIGSEVSSLFLPLLPVPSVPAADGMRCPLRALPLLQRSRGRASSGLGPCVPRPWIFLSSSGELCPRTSGRGEEPPAPGHGTDIPGLKAIS